MKLGNKKGFTLVELLLALGFVSVLLLAIVTTIIQISTAYNRGMTVKEVNQVTRLLDEDLRYNIGSSSAISFDGSGNLDRLSFAADSTTEPTSGRLCLGNYSYVWNYGRVIADQSANLSGDAVSKLGNKPVRMVKVLDLNKDYCRKASNSSSFEYTNIRESDEQDARELLSSGDRLLSLYDFLITSPASSFDSLTGQRLYLISIVIGSGDVSAINDGGNAERPWTCKLPGEDGSDLSYCVVQKIDLTIRAGSGV